jgi:hypothetical protein
MYFMHTNVLGFVVSAYGGHFGNTQIEKTFLFWNFEQQMTGTDTTQTIFCKKN